MKHINFLLISNFITINLFGIDLNSIIKEVVNTNPQIIQKKKEFNSVYETLQISQGDFFLPSVDFGGGISKVTTHYKSPNMTSKYTNKYFSLTATENLFNGFGTVRDIDAKKSMLASSAYSYVQAVNELALITAKTYLDVVKNKELLAVEIDNYKKHKKIFRAIQARSNAGVGVLSDFQEIKAKTSLAYANYIAQEKNLKASQISLRKLLGYNVEPNSLLSPTVGEKLIYTLPKAKEFAFTHNPALFIQKYNVITARYNMQRDKKEFLPKIDLVVSKKYVDGRNDDAIIDSKYNNLSMGVTFSWNLFRGFKDVHTKNKNISLIHSEYQKYNIVKRNLNAEIELSWMSYQMQQKEYNYLQNYLLNAQSKMETLTKLFRIGKKSLLELLAAQTDYNSAKEKLINTKYDLIFTKFRVLKAMGILPDMIDPSIKMQVGILSNGLYDYTQLQQHYIEDEYPTKEESLEPEISDNPAYLTDNMMDTYAVVNTSSIDKYQKNIKSRKVTKTINKSYEVEKNIYDDRDDEVEKKVYDEEYIAPQYR